MAEWKDGIAKIALPTPFPVGDVNVYVVKGERLTLIDVGPKTAEAFELLKENLKELNISPIDIEQVILTHHHADHAGLLDFFPESLEVYGHPMNDRWLFLTESFLSLWNEFFKKTFTEFGVPENYLHFYGGMKKEMDYSCNRKLTGYLNEGDTPTGLSDWRVVETPGHAQSHIGLYREKDGVYIGGDHLLAHISPNPIIEPPLPGETERPKSLLQYNDSLRKLINMPIQLVYSGHGMEIHNKNELIQIRLTEQRNRAYNVRNWLEKEPLTVFEACRRLFTKSYEKQLLLTISETIAQFDYLLDLKNIRMDYEDGVMRFKAI